MILPQNIRSLLANMNKAARRSQPSSLWYNVAGVLLKRFYCFQIWGPRYCSCYSIISFMISTLIILIISTQKLTLFCPPSSRAQLSCNMETQAPTNTIDQPSPSHLFPITGAVQPPKESWSSQNPSKPVPDKVLQLESRPGLWALRSFLYTRFHLPLLLPSSRLPPILSKPIQAELCKKARIFRRDFYSHSSLVIMGGRGSLQILNKGHFIP